MASHRFERLRDLLRLLERLPLERLPPDGVRDPAVLAQERGLGHVPGPVFARDAARPRPDQRLLRAVAGTMVVVGRDEAPQDREVVGQTAFRQPFQGVPRLGGRAGRGSRRTCGSGSWWYDPPRSMSRPRPMNMGGFG